MPELGFQERRSWRRRGGDTSPDSVIFTLESNLSLFSSASASVDRCSFASDAHDHDSLASEISLHLAVQDHDGDFARSESWSGQDPDPDLNKRQQQQQQRHADTDSDAVHGKHRRNRFSGKREKAKVQKEEDSDGGDTEDGNQHLEFDSARNSFSLALKECQDRRSRSETLYKKHDRRRPASLDLNNAIGNGNVSSPRLELGAMKKSTLCTRRSGSGSGNGNFPSPGTPNYLHASVAMQKGWSSERVPLHTSAARKQVGAALFPFNNGRTLPSKWEDAERWILSPVSGDGGTGRASLPAPQRRPKSKSGPLGPPGAAAVAYYSMYSPAVPLFESGNSGSFMAASPFSAAVSVSAAAADGLTASSGGSTDPCMARSVSVHGCSQMQSQSSLPAQVNLLSFVNSSYLLQDSVLLAVGRALFSGRGSENGDNWKIKESSCRSSFWDISGGSKTVSKSKREEAKINSWENLQKAKAEAAIRKLEMKLEKKRASSMDKIMTKLRLAQKKAQEMRSSTLANQPHQVPRTPHKAILFSRASQMGSLSGCFTCHAF
ncbi:hypothetical protein JHK85_049235 [Glycine max]|nr:hypothetical protein JHK85_049235 [Glycine max]